MRFTNILVGQNPKTNIPRVKTISNSVFHFICTYNKTSTLVYDNINNKKVTKMVAAIAVSSPNSTLLKNHINLKHSSSNFVGGSLKGLCLHVKQRQQRRDSFNLVVASATSSSGTTSSANGRFYFNFTGFPFPLGPFLNRLTIRTEVCYLDLSYVCFVAYFLVCIRLTYLNLYLLI